MRVEFKASFVRDLRRVRDKAIKERLRETIERVEEAQTLQEVGNVKKLRGGDQYYRASGGVQAWPDIGKGYGHLCSISASKGLV